MKVSDESKCMEENRKNLLAINGDICAVFVTVALVLEMMSFIPTHTS